VSFIVDYFVCSQVCLRECTYPEAFIVEVCLCVFDIKLAWCGIYLFTAM